MSARVVQFGQYRLLERINVGGMAEVYKAKLVGVEGFEKFLAIKRILPAVAADRDFISMFVDEAKISVQLNHAHIAQIFELGRLGDTYFIALEYVSGKDLRALAERLRRLGEKAPPELAAYVMSRVLEGLDYAHRKRDAHGRDLGIVHRDVSPQNVLVSYEGDVKLIDFGIAKAAGKMLRTQAGILKGKFGYMSPEQVRGQVVDRRSDVFAAGIVLHELLTGERLFTGSSDYSVLEKVRRAEVPRLRSVRRSVPPALERIVERALTREPADRYAWASDMAADLQRFLLSQDRLFTREDLASYMKRVFTEEFEREKRSGTEPSSDAASLAPNDSVVRPPMLRASARPRLEGVTARTASPPPPVVARPSRLPNAALASEEETYPAIPAPVEPDPSSITDPNLPAPPVADLTETLPPTLAFEETVMRARPPPPVIVEGDDDPDDLLVRHTDEDATNVRANAMRPVVASSAVRVARSQYDVTEVLPRSVWASLPWRQIGVALTTAALTVLVAGLGVALWRSGAVSQAWSDASVLLSGEERFARLTVVTDPPDAQVYLDDVLVRPVGSAPYTTERLPADRDHVVVARKHGFREAAEGVRLAAGESRTVQLVLRSRGPVVNVTTVPPGAIVTVDGERAGRSPQVLAGLAPGRHVVRAELTCYEPARQPVQVGDTDQTIELRLTPLRGGCIAQSAGAAQDAPGRLSLTSRPVARVFIDGVDTRRTTPLIDYPIAPGRRSVRLVAEGLEHELELDVRAGRSIQQQVTLR